MKSHFSKFVSFFRGIFSRRSDRLSFSLLLFILSVSLVTANLSLQKSLNYGVEYEEFPPNFSILTNVKVSESDEVIEQNFRGLNLTETLFIEKSTADNLVFPSSGRQVTFKIYGVDKGYQFFPVQNCVVYNSLKAFPMDPLSGHHFTSEDFTNASAKFITYSSCLFSLFGEADSTKISFNGVDLSLSAVLKDSSDVLRNSVSRENQVIQIFIPYSTFLEIFPTPASSIIVVRSFSHSFPLLDHLGAFMNKTKLQGLITERIFENLAPGLLILTAMTLLIFAAILIINLLSVSSNKLELGVRRALGARKVDIVREIIVKSSTLALVAGICSLIISLFVSTCSFYLSYPSTFSSVFGFFLIPSLLVVFLIFSLYLVTLLIPSIVASNVNISSVLKEEK